MEELQEKHRQEIKDLQARITQKKKAATKKTRKGVNDECEGLERQLKERHSLEISSLDSIHDDAVDDPPGGGSDAEEVETTQLDHPKPDIVGGLDGMSISTAANSDGHTKKPNRQKARLARRAAEQEAAIEQAKKEAADLPNLQKHESELMRKHYEPRGLKEREIRSDGHCLYAAIADQLYDSGVGINPPNDIEINGLDKAPASSAYKATRQVAAIYISKHADDFLPFLEMPLNEYVKTIRDTGEWGGHLELLALAKAYGVDINVLQGDGRVETIECGNEHEHSTLWLAYYRHSYGLGEHYNSLRRAKT